MSQESAIAFADYALEKLPFEVLFIETDGGSALPLRCSRQRRHDVLPDRDGSGHGQDGASAHRSGQVKHLGAERGEHDRTWGCSLDGQVLLAVDISPS